MEGIALPLPKLAKGIVLRQAGVMRLQQGQLWQTKTGYLRITVLERYGVEYKLMDDPATGLGEHLSATKKEFCRLLKGATLVDPKPTASDPEAP